MQRLACFTAIIIAVTTVSFLVNDDPVRELYKKVETLQEKYPREKVYLHFDKPYYSTGDTIFFKAYVLNAVKNLPSELSKILYVDLINQQDSVAASFTLPVADGIAAGTIPLTDSIEEGNYHIQAYTRWVRNFGDYVFDRSISIGDALNSDITLHSSFTIDEKNTGKSQAVLQYNYLTGHAVAGKEINYSLFAGNNEIAKGNGITDSTGKLLVNLGKYTSNNTGARKLITQVKPDNKKIITRSVYLHRSSADADVLFFAEGGQMVSGIPATIGFKAVNHEGYSVHVTGKVFGKDDVLVTSFESGFAGLGRFWLLPDHQDDYYAQVKFDDGTEKKMVLPKAMERGYALSVESADTDKLHIRIGVSPASDQDLILVAQSNNNIEYAAKNKPGASGFLQRFLKNVFQQAYCS